MFKRMKAEGKALEGAAHRVVPPLGQPQDRAARAVRRRRRPGGGLVHGHVLRALLPHADPQGRAAGGEPDGRGARSCSRTPFFIVFGALSDRIGRKWIIMAGCVLAALTYFPIFKALTQGREPGDLRGGSREPRSRSSPTDATAASSSTRSARRSSPRSCDIAKSWLAKKDIPYKNEAAPAGTVASVNVGGATDRRASTAGRSPPADVQGEAGRVRQGDRRTR